MPAAPSLFLGPRQVGQIDIVGTPEEVSYIDEFLYGEENHYWLFWLPAPMRELDLPWNGYGVSSSNEGDDFTVKVQVVSDPDPELHNEFAVTELVGDQIVVSVKARPWPAPYDSDAFYKETLTHEFAHVAMLLLEQARGTEWLVETLCDIFGAPTSAWEAGPWAARVKESAAETFKDVMFPGRRFDNRTQRRLQEDRFQDFLGVFVDASFGMPLEANRTLRSWQNVQPFEGGLGYHSRTTGPSSSTPGQASHFAAMWFANSRDSDIVMQFPPEGSLTLRGYMPFIDGPENDLLVMVNWWGFENPQAGPIFVSPTLLSSDDFHVISSDWDGTDPGAVNYTAPDWSHALSPPDDLGEFTGLGLTIEAVDLNDFSSPIPPSQPDLGHWPWIDMEQQAAIHTFPPHPWPTYPPWPYKGIPGEIASAGAGAGTRRNRRRIVGGVSTGEPLPVAIRSATGSPRIESAGALGGATRN
jgi:hypothetical protein